MKEEKKSKLDFIKKMGRRKTYLSNAGITLIALVVTVIVLLILAGVTLSLTLGENGIIGRAKLASNTWANVTKDEDTMYADVYSKIGQQSGASDEGNGGSGGESTGAGLKIGETDLSTVSDLSTMYGQETNYKSILHPDIKWQLFYADNSNYYIIASDYVPTSDLPCSSDSSGTDLNAPNGIADNQFQARFASTSSCDDYVMVSTVHSSGCESTAIIGNGLTSTYLKWVAYANTNNYTKNNRNMKAAAYMMDTTIWNSFADGASGAKAMGGPTIEMLTLSWNAVSGHTQKMPSYATLSDSNANNYGYITGIWSGDSVSETNMWFIKESTKAEAYWLASPSYYGGSYDLLAAGYWGDVTYDGYVNHKDWGFRPLVAVPRS